MDDGYTVMIARTRMTFTFGWHFGFWFFEAVAGVAAFGTLGVSVLAGVSAHRHGTGHVLDTFGGERVARNTVTVRSWPANLSFSALLLLTRVFYT